MKVLVLSDFSEVAINATHFCMDMLQYEKVDFTLLNVALPTRDSSEVERAQQKKQIEEKLIQRVRALRERASENHRVQGYYCEENLVSGTRLFLSKQHVDLIVMGAVGANESKNSILSEHTFEIMRKVKCNILAVPRYAVFDHFKKVLMPLLRNTDVSDKHLTFFKQLHCFKKSTIEIREIVSELQPQSEHDDSLLPTFGHLHYVEKVQMIQTILHDPKYWQRVQQDYDLICLFAKNIDVLDRLFNKEEGALRVIENRLPILVLHD